MKVSLLSIAKLENEYIREWVEYHLNLGIDEIYLADNNNINSESLLDVLSDLVDNGKVKIYNYKEVKNAMYDAYSYMYNTNEFDWICIIDCDEFITLKEKYKNIKDYLADAENYTGDIINAIALNWMCYGDNEMLYKENGNVVDRFKIPLDVNFRIEHWTYPHNCGFKSILKKLNQNIYLGHPHAFYDFEYMDNNFIPFDKSIISNWQLPYYNFERAYVRHYCTKTITEFINQKIRRSGQADNNDFKLDLSNYFYLFNKKTPEKEQAANNYLKNYI